MIDPQSIPLLLLFTMLILLIGGIITITSGRRLPRLGDGGVGAGFVIFVATLVFAAHALSEDDWKSKVWVRGWVWPPGSEGALTIGILQDRLGFLMAALTVMIAAAVMLNRSAILNNPRRERVAGGTALGASGVILSWLSATPWLSFIGIALAIFGGLVLQLCYWEENSEASNAARFAWERFGGLALSIFGACGIASSHTALVWGDGSHWTGAASATIASGNFGTDSIGTGFLILGLVAQFGAFPLSGWSIRPFRGRTWSRVIIAQVFPAWAAFAAIFRLSMALELGPLSMAIAGFMIMAGILSLVCGLAQKDLKSALSSWASAGFSIASAALLLAGQRVGFSLLIGMSLGIVSFSGICATLSADEGFAPSDHQEVPQAQWVAWAALLVSLASMAAATGCPGFISAGGGVHWLEVLVAEQPALAAAATFSLGLFAILGWKIFFLVRRLKFSSATPMLSIALPFLVLIPAIGILSSGMITGGALPDSPAPGPLAIDEVTPSLMGAMFDAPSASRDDTQFLAASGLMWGALVVGLAAAYWLYLKRGRTLELEENDKTGYGKVFRFISSGYRIDEAAVVAVRGLHWVGGRLRSWVDGALWSGWFPLVLASPFKWMGAQASRLDQVISDGTQRVTARVSELPSRGLQFVQNGDVQWYLIFSLGSGFLILLYFLRT